MMLENHCKGQGMFSMGNIKPVSNSVGISIPSREIIIAVCCESVTLEISNPIDKAHKMNNILILNNNIKLPLISMPNTVTLSNRMTDRLMMESTK